MVQFKAAPGSRTTMFNRLPQIAAEVRVPKVRMARTKKTQRRVLKPAEASGQGQLTTTAVKRSAAKQEIVQLPLIRLAAASASTKSNSAETAAGMAAAVGAGAAVLWILGVVILIFVVWGMVRSFQVMSGNFAAAKTGAAVNDDITASPWYFGILIGATVLYLVLNITGSALAGSASDTISNIDGSSAEADQEAAVKAAQNASGSQAAYGVASVFGIGAAVMAFIALNRLKFTKGALARSVAKAAASQQ